tara:strand:- start:247 stop:516 length:270 start_codon:yes stop_codon:yes gene_type:complete
MSSTYNWAITKDYISNGTELGLTGPHNKSRHTANELNFRMYDDNDELYYAGTIWGNYDGFEPLDDFGTPDAGCTSISYQNKEGEWVHYS